MSDNKQGVRNNTYQIEKRPEHQRNHAILFYRDSTIENIKQLIRDTMSHYQPASITICVEVGAAIRHIAEGLVILKSEFPQTKVIIETDIPEETIIGMHRQAYEQSITSSEKQN